MNILVLGKGGREHALSWKLSHSSLADKVFVMPGNAGIETEPAIECLEGNPLDFEFLGKTCKELAINMVVVGPEAYLEAGIVDFLNEKKIPCIGPRREGAQLESSKAFSKQIMKECDIPTAQFEYFDNVVAATKFIDSWPYSGGLVVKADGLASGKGVFVCDTKKQAHEAIDLICIQNTLNLENPNEIIIEEKLVGRELSAFALSDGIEYLYLGDACDYKRLLDEDQGPNTGGMGCYSPADWIDNEDRQFIKRRIFEKLFKKLKQKHLDFKGILFAGLIKTKSGEIKVLEFNTRFGDPEAQVILPRLECDLAKIFHAAMHKKLELVRSQFKLSKQTTCHVVKASGGYPGIDGTPLEIGKKITIEDRFKLIQEQGNKIFFAGVGKNENGELINTGGRVLGVTTVDEDRIKAREKIYKVINMVHFEDEMFRKDIGR